MWEGMVLEWIRRKEGSVTFDICDVKIMKWEGSTVHDTGAAKIWEGNVSSLITRGKGMNNVEYFL